MMHVDTMQKQYIIISVRNFQYQYNASAIHKLVQES